MFIRTFAFHLERMSRSAVVFNVDLGIVANCASNIKQMWASELTPIPPETENRRQLIDSFKFT